MLSRAKGGKIYGGQKKLPMPREGARDGAARGRGRGDASARMRTVRSRAWPGCRNKRVPRGARARTARPLLPAPARTLRPPRDARPGFPATGAGMGRPQAGGPGTMRRPRVGAGKARDAAPAPGAHWGHFGSASGNGPGGREGRRPARGGRADSGQRWRKRAAQAPGAAHPAAAPGRRPARRRLRGEARRAPRGISLLCGCIPQPHIPGDKKFFAPAEVDRVNIKKAALPEKRECPSRTRERPCSP